ncbi:hypothetical protein Tco_1053259 [Tanacetum coccineum]
MGWTGTRGGITRARNGVTRGVADASNVVTSRITGGASNEVTGGITRRAGNVTNASSGVTSGITRRAGNVTGVVVVWVIMGLMSASKYSYRDHNCWNSANSL